VRLDGVIKSTFSRDYQPNVPSFTTNFFSNTAKTISCGIDNITNPHNSFTVKLARPDGAILDTRVLNDASSFFLQFTELDYGTYDYQVLLNDTQVATHQHIFVRPEPSFTTSWAKCGLTISADLSGITNAHSSFYAYLCRDDGATLATHQFQTGQTTTSLSFTEADYGSYNYQLKLGTVVKSSHAETYVRPTPTYTASFSTNELTLTASITSITNAHNSFAITLERDDETVLQTHTLVDGETSFTFTQTETSYATYNYVVKLNGTQTDTYSATYTPPPIPTFDIALANTDLAITASITNITNPHSYYTVSIHDASSQLASHIFQTTDTSVSLNWNETTYGEKSYTIKINGVTSSTQSIMLTDPNTPYTRLGLTLLTHPDSSYNSGTWAGSHSFAEVASAGVNTIPTSATGIFDMYFNSTDSSTGHSGQDGFSFKYENGTWSDIGVHAPVAFTNTSTYVNQTSVADGEYIYLWASSTECRARFVSPYYEAPSTTYNFDSNDFPIITPSGGDWLTWAQYRYRSDDSAYVYYDLWNTQAANGGDFSYDEDDNTREDGGYQIRVSKTTGDWEDYPHTGTHPPTGVTDNDTNVTLGTLFTFVKPSGTYQNKSQTPWNTPSTPVEPNVLTHTNSALYGSYEWRYHSQTTTPYLYGMYHIGNDAFFDVPTSLIQVGKSGQSDYNTWSDANTLAHPNQVVDNGTTVSLNYSGTPYSFNKPTSASWIQAIEPQTITPTSVNPAWGGATYIWKETVGTSEIYTLAFGGVATNNNHEIQVDTTTNTWSDYGTNNPHTVTDNGSTVTLSSGTTTFVVFNKPTSASWL